MILMDVQYAKQFLCTTDIPSVLVVDQRGEQAKYKWFVIEPELFEGIPAVEHSMVGKGKVRGVHQVFSQDFPAIGQLSIVILPHKTSLHDSQLC
jgi:hypothetical protein